ncbi:hypothetical protein, partial [Pseudonocardia nigra]|uniref:hypothetical protein n=1 Tax=Pseudonocardia nigra TaxID=1921578 RepID=UPI003557C505
MAEAVGGRHSATRQAADDAAGDVRHPDGDVRTETPAGDPAEQAAVTPPVPAPLPGAPDLEGLARRRRAAEAAAEVAESRAATAAAAASAAIAAAARAAEEAEAAADEAARAAEEAEAAAAAEERAIAVTAGEATGVLPAMPAAAGS